jgi:uncharacterized membrane protein
MNVLLWSAALSSGLMAGVYFTFSAFIMKAFSKIETIQSVAAMNSINKTILFSLFMPIFFGSTIISLLLVIIAVANWSNTDTGLILIAGATYFVGMFICTVAFNVPLNNSLAKQDENSTDIDSVWEYYLQTWTKWNHIRVICSLTTCILCIWILSK